MVRVLLIEDDDDAAVEIAAALTREDYAVVRAADGIAALELAQGETWDLLIVDRMLPRMDGLSLIRALRAAHVLTPALVLSALDAVDERISGLRAGGDDYLVKPFAFGELIARLEALLRRFTDSHATTLRAGVLELDLIRRRAKRGDRTLDLLAREFQLLECMVRHRGQVVTRSMLIEEVWNYRFPMNMNVVDVHMGRLRRKLDLEGEAALIETVRGSGFRLRASS